MAYATVNDVQARMTKTMSQDEQNVCEALLSDAAVLIDSVNYNADLDVKALVSCRMVIRALSSGDDTGYPMGATQGSMAGLGYSQSWTISGGGGSFGELYLSKLEKQMLGAGNKIGSYSPVQELVPGVKCR